MSDIAVRVRNVTKDFEIYDKPMDLALEVLTRRKRHRTFRALDDVSFELERGQVLGIIGPNGAGKSTLLKIITGVLDATAGRVEVSGRVTAILELGLGFNPEHSGRDNIYLSGLLYGMGREEIDRKLDAIIDFSGLHDFIDQPVKTYSSGMHGRLAFSIATAVDPEVLVIDEALAAGDAMFVYKCMRRIRELCAGGHTVLVVSHGTGILAQLCRDVLWLEHGRIRMNGPALQVVQAYDLQAHQAADVESWIEKVEDAPLGIAAPALPSPEAPVAASPALADLPAAAPVAASLAPAELPAAAAVASAEPAARSEAATLIARQPTATAFSAEQHSQPGGGEVATGKYVFRRGPVFIDSVTMLDHAGSPSTRLTTVRPFTLRIAYHCKGELPQETLGVALAINRLADLEPVLQWYTQFIRPDETRESYGAAAFRLPPSRRGVIELVFPYAPFRQGDYILSIGLLPNTPGTWEFYEYRHFFYPFHVTEAALCVGAPIFFEPHKVSFVDLDAPADADEVANA